MRLQSRLIFTLVLGMLAVPSSPTLATTYRYVDENGDSVIAQQPPKAPFTVLDDEGEFLWNVPANPIPISHWRPFWVEPKPDPFNVPEIRQRRPVVTIEELADEAE